jgi:phosphoadenosine phosphosulfate reductase
MAYFKNGVFASDPWDQTLEGDARRCLLTLPEWQERHEAGQPLPSPLGLVLEPGVAVEELGDHVQHFDLIAIAFPKFTDGRGYSMAWLLRSRLGYKNELRAVGDVLFDEMQFMVRCGFDAFDVVDGDTMRLLQEGRRGAFDRFYQPGLEPEVPEGTRPWARRPAAPRSGNLA